MKKTSLAILAGFFVATISGCATETSTSLPVVKTEAAYKAYIGPKIKISIGKFENRSDFLRGIFSDGVDRLGNQSKTILTSHLQQTNRFSVLDRENMKEMNQESRISNTALQLKGAKYIISGDVTEFGRKEVGDKQLFGILGRGKSQIAYAKVTLNIINAETSEVAFSSQGAGEFELSNREVIGFGGTASYDSTLNGKVLDLAIRQAIDVLTDAVDNGAWKPEN